MPQFVYTAKKGPGDPVTGTIEAENQRAAVARLRDLGYFPVRIEEAKTSDVAKPAKKEGVTTPQIAAPSTRLFARNKVRLKDRNVFFRQLANLSESGMPLTRALRTIAEQTDNKALAALVDDLRESVQKGASFAEALERHPQVFSAMITNLVRAGETGGMLEEVLWRIVTFGEQEEELRGKAFSALVYPAFLLVIGSIAVFILVSFVFPKFVTVFEEFHARLPWPTVVVMAICTFMGRWWWAVLAAVLGLIAGLVYYFQTTQGKYRLHKALLSVPVVRDVVQKYEMAKFARTLGTLLDNGVPVLTALRITEDTLGNVLIKQDIAAVHTGVAAGESLSDCMRRAQYFPPLVVSMFAVGEESGRIGAVSKRIADAYDLEVDRAVKAMAALFEPILIVVMGIVIGFLVIAMLLPMLTLSSSIGA